MARGMSMLTCVCIALVGAAVIGAGDDPFESAIGFSLIAGGVITWGWLACKELG